jgi:2-dehydropantoate 2-reductase
MLKPVDWLLNQDASRRMIVDMMLEVIAGGNAQGLVKDIPVNITEKLVSSSLTLGPYKPSMLIDRIEGRPLELDAIFSIPLTVARREGVQMPRVETLLALLQLTKTVKDSSVSWSIM